MSTSACHLTSRHFTSRHVSCVYLNWQVVQDLVDVAAQESTLLATKEQEINLLHQALMIDLSEADAAETKAIQSSLGKNNYDSFIESTTSKGASRKSGGTLSDLSGAGKSSYLEYSASSSSSSKRWIIHVFIHTNVHTFLLWFVVACSYMRCSYNAYAVIAVIAVIAIIVIIVCGAYL